MIGNAANRQRVITLLVAAVVFASCSKGGGSRFAGVASRQPVAPVVENEQKNDDSVPEPVVTPPPNPDIPNPPPVVIPTRPSAAGGLSIEPEIIQVPGDTPVQVHWSYAGPIEDLEVFVIRVFDAHDSLVFEEEIPVNSETAGGAHAQTLSQSFAPGSYIVEISGFFSHGGALSTVQGTLTVDNTGPYVRLYPGVFRSADACSTPPGQLEFVATRVASYDYCVRDLGSAATQVSKVCLARTETGEPEVNDACWTDPANLPRLMLLSSANNGLNSYTLYARDAVGNVGFDSRSITMLPTIPPRVDILEPTSQSLAGGVYRAGETKTLRWWITDEDTQYKDIKIVVTLMEADDPTKFTHLACNFVDNPVFRQCPSPMLENSPLIVSEGNDRGSFSFTVPANWDTAKSYLLLVTAIDKAGNAAVASTQEINAGWQVMAGRTYKGIGSSGVTIAQPAAGSITRTDRLGQLYSISQNFKLRAFDNRSCRMLKRAGAAAEPFDCDDIIETQHYRSLVTGFWVYDGHRDVFYATNDGKIYLIDFNARQVQVLFGAGSTPLTRDLTAGRAASAYAASGLNHRLSFDASHRHLYFIDQGCLYYLDTRNSELRYVLGNGSAETGVGRQNDVRQRDVVLPSGVISFAVTKDYRVIMGASAPPHWPLGGGRAPQYLITNFDPANSSTTTSIIPLGLHGIESPDETPLTDSIADIEYSSADHTIYAVIKWIGLYAMTIPSSESASTAYTWRKVNLREGGHSHSAARIPGTNLFYVNYRSDGRSFLLDRDTGTEAAVLGFEIGSEGDQLGQNRYLELPLHVQAMSDSVVYFNDRYNLNRLSLDGNGWQGQTKIASFAMHPFHIQNDKIYQAAQFSLVTYALSTGTEIARRSTGHSGYWSTRETLVGIGRDMRNLKTVFVGLDWNSVAGTSRKSTLFLGNFSLGDDGAIASAQKLRLSAVEPVGSNYCGNNGTALCTQAVAEISGGAAYFAGADYRLDRTWGWYGVESHNNVVSAAFNEQESGFFGCANQNFFYYDISAQKLYNFSAEKVEGGSLSCNIKRGLFRWIDGALYFARDDGFYRVKTDEITTRNRAVFERVSTRRPVLTGDYGGFDITPNYIYYTHTPSRRLIRNER